MGVVIAAVALYAAFWLGRWWEAGERLERLTGGQGGAIG